LERRHLDLSGSHLAGINETTLHALRTALHGDAATALHALTLVQQLAQNADFTPELRDLLRHDDPRIRAAALEQLGVLQKADALGNIGVRGFFRPLLAFLRDHDLMVRRRAIAAAGKLRTPELIPALVEQFQRRETALEAASALAAFGPGIEPQLREILLDEG